MTTSADDPWKFRDIRGGLHKTAEEAVEANQNFEESAGGRWSPSGSHCPQDAKDAHDPYQNDSQSGSSNQDQSGNNQNQSDNKS
jgi:hypothetical protein